jgi:hypothetical protein
MTRALRLAPPLCTITLALVSAGAAVAPAARSPRPGVLAPLSEPYAPQISPSDFVTGIDNPWLPYTPGTRLRFEGVRGKTPQRDVEVVLHRTKTIQGVRATIVRDTVSERGHVAERTDDWYAQDRRGNVWYLGEASFERRHGRLVRAGDSWEWGVDGALPGIIMPARPRTGDAYRQEHYVRGEALDQARVLPRLARLTVLYGTFQDVLVTSERSPLEPQTEHKYFVRGLGEIAERVVKGHHESFDLVSATH